MSELVIIEKESQVEELIHHCKQTRYASHDYETTSFKFQNKEDYPLILGVSFQPGSSWIIPLGHKESPFRKIYPKVLKKFGREVLEDRDIVKVGWNIKFENKWSLRYDINTQGRLFDAMLAKYCLDEEMPHDLKNFVSNFFPQYAGYENELKIHEETGELRKVDWLNTPYDKLCAYCGKDSDLTLKGMVIMEPKLIKLGFYRLYRNLLSGILKVLSESEYRGLLADRLYLEKLQRVYAVKLKQSEDRLKNTPALLKYEQKYKRKHLRDLIQNIRLDIARINEEDAPNAGRLIANREAKIKGFLEGKFANKERYDGFNFNSPDQLKQFFFLSKLGLRLKPIKFTKDKNGRRTDNPSTAEDVLDVLKKDDKSGFMQNLLDHRALVKLESTYITGMYEVLDSLDRIHANYRANGTVTGRLSCVKPNMQNIPRGSTAADIKRQFIPPPGYLLYEIDYSQAELRIVAAKSRDKAMLEIFAQNYNPHVATACKMNGGIKLYPRVKDILKVAEAMDAKTLALPENKKYLRWVKNKKKGKSQNFSILYQQGDKAMAEALECSEKEAKQFRKEWFAQYPGVEKWVKRQKRLCHEQEYVMSYFGRKRRLHDANCGDSFWEAEAERQAVNAPIQADSGDYTLFSQVVIREEQLKGNIPLDFLHAYTVHDSIGYYIRPYDVSTLVPKLEKICENPQTLRYFGFELKGVRMKVASEVGLHWAALKDFDPWTDYIELEKTRDTILSI
jgi:DNA polymerase-1